MTDFKQHTDNAVAYLASAGDLNNTTNPISVSVETDTGAVFAEPGNGQYVTIWDKATYPDPTDDPAMERAIITARTGDSITLARAEAVAHAGAVAIGELARSAHFEDLETAVETLETSVAAKSSLVFDAIVATSGGDYTTVGEALDAGKTRIRLMPGTYVESNKLNTYTAGTKIYIEGTKKEDCIIKMSNTTLFFDAKVSTHLNNLSLWVSAMTCTDGDTPGWVKVRDDFLIENCKLITNNSNPSGSYFFGLNNSDKLFEMNNCEIMYYHANHLIHAPVNINPRKLVLQNNTYRLVGSSATHPASSMLSLTSGTGTHVEVLNNNVVGSNKDWATSYPLFQISGGCYFNFIGNSLRNIGHNCIKITAASTTYTYVNISDNIFDTSINAMTNEQNSVIYWAGTSVNGRLKLSDNVIYNSWNVASCNFLYANALNDGIITNNLIASYYSAATSVGFNLVNPVNCLVTGNTFKGLNGTSNIAISVTGTNTNYVFGNVFDNCTAGATLAGTIYTPINGSILGDTSIAAPTPTEGGTITDYYGTDGNFLADPDLWIPIKIGATDYKLPLYE